MNATQFTLTAYAIGLGVLLGYALHLWAQFHTVRRGAERRNAVTAPVRAMPARRGAAPNGGGGRP